jgi:low temperature requirement protein LtrA
VADRERVSTLELFFDLVFVFVLTQLTDVLTEGHDLASLGRVVVMLAAIWWMYDGYAWLTNNIETERPRFRVLLLGGMGGFLIIALAVPHADEGDGLAFALAYLVVTLLHSGMYYGGATREILRIARFNLVGAVLLVIGGALGGDAQWVLWTIAVVVQWSSPAITGLEGIVVGASHFVERHGLVIIIALGESVVVIGVGASGLELDFGLVLAALLALALNALLWWVYFSDEEQVEEAFAEDPSPKLALIGFGYWHLGLLLAVIAVAAGLKKGLAHPYDELETWIAIGLAGGTALFVLSDVGFRRTFGVARNRVRGVVAVLALLTIPLGTEVGAAVQVAALAALVLGGALGEQREAAA